MSPTPLPALPSTSVSAARLNVFHNVKRAQEGTDVTTIVLVAVCVVFLLVILFSVARYFNRESSPFSPSSSGPSGRFTLRQFFPPQLRSRCTSNRASCTPTVGHSDPFPPLPKDLTRPWSEYHPAYPRVHHPLPPCPYRSCRASEYRPGGLDEYQPGGRIPLGRRAFSVYLADGLPTHRKPRPSNTMRPPVRKSVSVQEVGPPPERSSSNDVNEVVVQPVQILQPPEPQSALSTLAVAREPSIATSEEAQIGHTVGDECDTDTASESASGTATPKAGTDERRLGECEPSEARRDKYTGSVSLHSTFSDDDDSDNDEASDVDEESDGKDKPHGDSGESTHSVEQCRSAVPEVLEPQISPLVSFDDLADLYYFEDEDDEDAINRSYSFSLELVGSSNRPGSYLGIPGAAPVPPAVRVSCYRPVSPPRPPCQRSSADQECAEDQETQSPIIDKAGMDVGLLSDSVRASVWGRVCQETLNAVIVVAEAEAETEHQLLRLDSNVKTASSPKDDTERHPDDDASHVRDLRSISTDNPAMTTILEEKEKGESNDCESPNKDADIELDVILRELRHSLSVIPCDECAKEDGSLVHGRCASILSFSSSSATSWSCDSLAGMNEGKQADSHFYVVDPISKSPASAEPMEVEDEEVDPLPGVPAYATILVRTHRRTHALHDKRLEEFVGCERPSDDCSASITAKRSGHDPSLKWASVNGMIIIKVFVPATDDTWKVRVPEDITLQRFTSKVLSKLGFHVAFSGSCFDGPEYYFRTDDVFHCWVCKRIRHGRNLPIAAHVVGPPVPSKTHRVDAPSIPKPACAMRSDPLFRYRDSLDVLVGRISSIFQSPIGRFHRWDG